MILQAVPAKANEDEMMEQVPEACRPVANTIVEACNNVLFQAELYVGSQEKIIGEQQELINAQATELDKRMLELEIATADKRVWHKNPAYMTALGFIAGALTISIIQR